MYCMPQNLIALLSVLGALFKGDESTLILFFSPILLECSFHVNCRYTLAKNRGILLISTTGWITSKSLYMEKIPASHLKQSFQDLCNTIIQAWTRPQAIQINKIGSTLVRKESKIQRLLGESLVDMIKFFYLAFSIT